MNGDGEASITGLTDGTYRLTETKAPAGFIMISSPIGFIASNGTITYEDHTDGLVSYAKEEDADIGTLTIGNTPGAELPATGGPGTMIYTIAGMLLITLAGTLLAARKRKVNR